MRVGEGRDGGGQPPCSAGREGGMGGGGGENVFFLNVDGWRMRLMRGKLGACDGHGSGRG